MDTNVKSDTWKKQTTAASGILASHASEELKATLRSRYKTNPEAPSGVSKLSGKPLGTKGTNGYWKLTVRIGNTCTYVSTHRLAWWLTNGDIPDGMQIDHIDRNVDNNRIDNLRLVTCAENNQNKSALVTSRLGMKHISKRHDRELFTISIIRNGKRVVRYAKTLEEAVRVRDANW